ncbi:porin [Burkholderia sp. Ax-1719]|uniref:porin n=1 Tax=Burkholderia sp. Ax-1719 TaxID=2608334 RepID=UPI001420A324|nr:porin [Burkholderia sp. Ax-1719]NIE66923.1 porin [Burkholderia sp. Ax-1719]
MIKKFALGAICAMGTASAFAQSSVTLYGAIDTSLRYTTNNSGTNGAASEIGLTAGGIQGSRWGLKGSEDLGNGTKALFDLESGFVLNDGTADQQGQLFGRQAWVGLSNPTFGRLLAGRIYGIPFGLLSDFDPLGIGNYLENEYIARIIGVRFDNTLDYSISRGPFSLELQRSFGGQVGSVSQGSTTAIGLTYQAHGLEVGGVAHESKDSTNKRAIILGGGANYSMGPVTGYLMYVNARRDAGFSIASTTGGALANTSLLGNSTTIYGANTQTAQRVDSYMSFGVSYRVTPTFLVTGAFYQDNVAHVVDDQSGRIRTALLNVDYFLSKRTDIYAEVDRNWLSGASVTDPNNPPLSFGGKSTRTGVGIGLRTRF